MNKSKLLLNLLFGFFLVSCQSTRVIYQQQVGPNHKDEFAVLAHHDEIYFFTLDCHDSSCQIRECTDSTYAECPNLVAECKNDELKLMKFKNTNNTTSEVRICKNFEKKFVLVGPVLRLLKHLMIFSPRAMHEKVEPKRHS